MLHKSTLGWLITLVIAIVQCLAYLFVLPLSLGPRVILQPWLMRHGYLLYEHIADEHSPLMYILLSALVPLFSDGLMLAKVAMISLIAASTLLTFWVAQRSDGWRAGIWAAFFFGTWSPIFGYGKLWHETFLAPLYILMLTLWRPVTSTRPNIRSSLLIGLLAGLAVLIKQHAVAVLIALVLWNIIVGWQAHRPTRTLCVEATIVGAAASLPIVAFATYHYLRAGTIENLVFWTITFNFINHYTQAAAMAPTWDQIRTLIPAYLLVLPFTLQLLSRAHTGKDALWWSTDAWSLTLLAASTLTVYPRFGFFHLQPSLPVLAWVSGVTLSRNLQTQNLEASVRIIQRPFAIGITWALASLWMFHAGFTYYYSAFLTDQPRKIWEYTDLVPLAAETRQHIGPTECIYVMPDDEATANLYYLMRCNPPHFWTPTSYSWFMLDSTKVKIIQSLEQEPPDWIVYFPGRWNIEQHAQEVLAYINAHYQRTDQLSWAEGEVWLLQRQP